MAQSIVTKAFEKWNALNVLDGIASRPDQFVFALVPNQDANKIIDREEKIPTISHIKHIAPVTQYGLLNENAVVYSCVLDTSVGDFDYNWIGLVDSKTNTVIMIVHVETQKKIKTQNGIQGNNLTRNFCMEFDGAAEATQINVTAETWQIDFSARLFGIDEQYRLANFDIYGDGAFFDKGFLVEKTGSQCFINAGLAYIGGLRTELLSNQNLTIANKPTSIYVDSCWTGTVTGRWSVKTRITVSNFLSNYIDATGLQHYVFAVASIDAAGNITDLRRQGTIDRQYNEKTFSRKNHSHEEEYSDINHSHDDLYLSQKNSLSEIKSAGATAQKTARDNISAAPIDSPAFTGAPQAPTQSLGDNTTKLATTAFVQVAINALPKIDLTQYLKITDADNKFALKSITVNGQPLNKNVNLLASDVNAFNKTESDARYALSARKINTKPLTADIVLTAEDIGAAPSSHGHTDLSKIDASNINVASYLTKLGLKEASLSGNGWQKLPSGLIIQWGFVEFKSQADVKHDILFSIKFPTSVISFSSHYLGPFYTLTEKNTRLISINTSAFNISWGNGGGTTGGYWFAIGY